MTRFFKDNGLTIVLMLLFLGSILGHWLAGLHFQNEELAAHGQPPLGPIQYLGDPQFLSTVFENWESEFLQMSAYVVLTAYLYQRGSSESADPDAGPRKGDRIRKNKNHDAPGPLRYGIITRWTYGHSLGIVLMLLFIASFAMHWIFSAKEAATEALLHGEQSLSVTQYLGSSQLWFESFQNWQSEFLSIGAMVYLSVYLRQRGSPESKAVETPHDENE